MINYFVGKAFVRKIFITYCCLLQKQPFSCLQSEMSQTSFYQTLNELEHVDLLVLELEQEHPIFGFEQ